MLLNKAHLVSEIMMFSYRTEVNDYSYIQSSHLIQAQGDVFPYLVLLKQLFKT